MPTAKLGELVLGVRVQASLRGTATDDVYKRDETSVIDHIERGEGDQRGVSFGVREDNDALVGN